jgi:glycosidase
MEFHVSRAARDHYRFDQSLYQITGNVVLANPRGAHEFAHRMNDLRDRTRYPDRFVHAGELNAMGLIDELSHLVVKLYDEHARKRTGRERRVFSDGLDFIISRVGAEATYATLERFTEAFPPVDVYRGAQSSASYLAANSVDALEELLMLWLENANPAFDKFDELFDDESVAERTQYRQMMGALQEFLEQQPKFGPDDQTLIEVLRAPALASPDSLAGQLRFIERRWSSFLGESFAQLLSRVLTGVDLIREDEKAALSLGPGGPGPALVPSIEQLSGREGAPDGDIAAVEYEAFTPDREWMPRLVLMAKNAYVWLDQLSRKYQRAITRLDQVPDEELDRFARWGITGLWLIGLWQRSEASRRIKQMMGAQDAVASAYSLYDYRIADDLGGDAACEVLRAQAWRRGIRLASDMVPNHMGIDSKWVIDRPDYFLSLDHPPYPSYTFNGPDLSSDGRVGIFLEEHYYSHSDAAVVFKRVDKWTGDARYIYHGNDGTSMPWNDTAQIDYLNADAREAVIQTILHVARQFPVVRFDAAMTLAKRHVRRLWFPEPGSGGAIPSRAGHGMSAEQFEALMPNEFWREVVDRAAIEAPDTLLLAEAFWMLEGYFVRTLGMHRVYNSAFMNMLRDEKNADYRQLIKNTIEFDPEILRRYVNFMNNPDEKTAVEQFGRGDKYFGICVLMCTMPGLPMFGHGQVEGYTEKYGMEFRYPKLWESPDPLLIERHEGDIFPLLKKRYLFAGVDRFRLFDFYSPDGRVNEDVFAYSNRFGDERALVIYHNRFAQAGGWLRTSAAFVEKHGEDRSLTQETLGQALGLHDDDAYFAIFHEQSSGREFICSSRDLCQRGLYLELGAYACHVFSSVHEVQSDAERPYAELNATLGQHWVGSIHDELEILRLAPVRRAYTELVNGATLTRLREAVLAGAEDVDLLAMVDARAKSLVAAIKAHTQGPGVEAKIVREIADDVNTLFDPMIRDVRKNGSVRLDPDALTTLIGWLLVRRLGEVTSPQDGRATSRAWLTRWRLGDPLQEAFVDSGMDSDQAWAATMQVKVLMSHGEMLKAATMPGATPQGGPPAGDLRALFDDADARALLRVHEHDGKTYFDQQAFEALVTTLHTAAAFERFDDAALSAPAFAQARARERAAAEALIAAAKRTGYQVELLLAGGETQRSAPVPGVAPSGSPPRA